MSVTAGLYLPRASPLHQAPAGTKLLGLAAAIVVLLALDSVVALAVAGIVIAGLYAVAAVPWRVAAAQLRPLLWFCVVILVLQLVLADWAGAVTAVLTLVLAVALAALVTLTTRVSAMLDVAERGLGPLRRVGVDPARVALVLALAIRGVPLIAGVAQTVREAQQARGVSRNPLALLTPVLVRLLRRADALGEALAARGVDDDAPATPRR